MLHSVQSTSVSQSLVNCIRQRDREGFRQLYSQFAHIIFGMSYKVTRNTVVSEDIVQETFVKVWKNIDQYNPEKAAFATWILNIARYTIIDYLRSRQHKQSLKNQNEGKIEYNTTALSSAPNIDTTGIKSLVTRLEPKYREIIDLIYFAGHTREETAAILDIPVGTVKTRARYALKMLRNMV